MMKIVVITQQTAFIRHWFKWYRVQRAGEDWRPLKIQKYEKQKSVRDIAKSLSKKYPSKPLPDILDEKKADEIVRKNMPKS